MGTFILPTLVSSCCGDEFAVRLFKSANAVLSKEIKHNNKLWKMESLLYGGNEKSLAAGRQGHFFDNGVKNKINLARLNQ